MLVLSMKQNDVVKVGDSFVCLVRTGNGSIRLVFLAAADVPIVRGCHLPDAERAELLERLPNLKLLPAKAA